MFHYQLSSGELGRLRQHRALPGVPGERQEKQVEYFDTPDAQLSNKGILLARVRIGWEWRLEVLQQPDDRDGGIRGGLGWRAELLAAAYCGPSGFEFGFVPDKGLRQWLQKQAGKLQRICVETAKGEQLLVDTAAGAAGLLLERVDVQGEAGGQSLGRVHVLPQPGGEAAAFLLCRALLSEHALEPAMLSPVDLARRRGQTIRASRARPSLPTGGDGRQAFLHIARNCVSHLCLNLPGLAVSDDPEFVHQVRVAIRRLRSALKLFAPWLPQSFVTEFGERWRDMGNALGDCRNLDVFLAETLPLLEQELKADTLVARLKNQALRQRRQVRQAARAMLSGSEARLLLLDFEGALNSLVVPESMPPLRKLARRRLASRARQVVRLGEAVRNLDPEARHELRIAFKKLRYALEFFAGLFGEKRSKAYLAGLVDLQEVLGHLNDLATAQSLLHSLLPPAAARLPDAWLAGRAGALVAALPTAIGHFLDAEAPWE